MRIKLKIVTLAFSVLVGCRTTQPPATREALVGNYIYVSNDPENKPTDHDLEHLTLRSDGTYDLTQGGSTKAITDRNGVWRIVPGDPPDVELDDAGYPIEIKGEEVRLMIDYDVGIWYAKRQ